jgi:hypothetical protein
VAGAADELTAFARGLLLVGIAASRMAAMTRRAAATAAISQKAVADARSKIVADAAAARVEIQATRALWAAGGGGSGDSSLKALVVAAQDQTATGGL